MIRLATILVTLLLVTAAPDPASARQDGTDFASALDAFRTGRYDAAADAFAALASARPDDPNVTFAMAMHGKALYRAGRYGEAITVLGAFVDRHADSRYADDARRTLEWAREARDALAVRPAPIGIILSLDTEELLQTQDLFNGIHLAVDRHNRSDERPVRMVFREIGTDPASAGAAVRALADEGVSVVMGALFSDQAREAAAAAESAGVVFVAPLATDESVSMRRRLVFQANPTIEMRGRLMARMAVNGLLLDTLATIAGPEPTGISRRMTRGFVNEALELGAGVPIQLQLESQTDWYRLDGLLSADTLRGVRGLYLPISGAQNERTAGAVLTGLDRMGVNLRVLGNAEWHDLPMTAQASRYTTTYSNDYFPDPERPATAAFDADYLAFAGERPGRLAHAGFDVTSFILEATRTVGLDADPERIARAFHEMPPWEGVAHRIEFADGQVNRSMFYHRYREGRLELLR